MKRSNKFFNMLIKEYRLRPFILNNSLYLYYVKYAYLWSMHTCEVCILWEEHSNIKCNVGKQSSCSKSDYKWLKVQWKSECEKRWKHVKCEHEDVIVTSSNFLILLTEERLSVYRNIYRIIKSMSNKRCKN